MATIAIRIVGSAMQQLAMRIVKDCTTGVRLNPEVLTKIELMINAVEDIFLQLETNKQLTKEKEAAIFNVIAALSRLHRSV